MLGKDGRYRRQEPGLVGGCGPGGLHDLRIDVYLRVRHPPRRTVDLGQAHAQLRCPGQAFGDRGPQPADVERPVQLDDLARVPGDGLVLQRQDALALGRQAPRARSLLWPPISRHDRCTPPRRATSSRPDPNTSRYAQIPSVITWPDAAWAARGWPGRRGTGGRRAAG